MSIMTIVAAVVAVFLPTFALFFPMCIWRTDRTQQSEWRKSAAVFVENERDSVVWRRECGSVWNGRVRSTVWCCERVPLYNFISILGRRSSLMGWDSLSPSAVTASY